jgi:hypothetical protein
VTPTLAFPPPPASALVRDAISAAEALHAYHLAVAEFDSAAAHGRRYPRFLDALLRREEAIAALRVLASTLVDLHVDESHEHVVTARQIAGRLALVDVEAADVDGYEAWCRELAGGAAHG